MLIKIRTVAPHPTWVQVQGVTVWFSYEEPVAFENREGSWVVTQNVWGQATGRHLNAIDGGDVHARVTRREFLRRLSEVRLSEAAL